VTERLWRPDELDDNRRVLAELRELVAILQDLVKAADDAGDKLDELVSRARREARHLATLTDTAAGVAGALERRRG
jgi:hypothetical protein